jgi:hypothetical protein
MSLHLRAFGVALLGSSQLFAASVDFNVINGVFKSIADEVVKAEQVKDKAGKDLIDRLEVKFGKDSDVSTGSIAFKSGVYLNGATWAPTTASSLNLDVNTQVAEIKGSSLLMVAANLSLKSDTAALVRYAATQNAASSSNPCSPSNIKNAADPLEEKFNEDACVEMAKLPAVKDTAAFLDIVQTILEKRETYLTSRLKELALTNESSRTKRLTDEQPYVTKAVAALKARTSKDSVHYVIKEETEVFGATKLTGFDLAISPSSASVGITLSSPEGAGFYEMSKRDLEDLATKMSLPDSDPEKAALVSNLKAQFKEAVSFAKEIVLPK